MVGTGRISYQLKSSKQVRKKRRKEYFAKLTLLKAKKDIEESAIKKKNLNEKKEKELEAMRIDIFQDKTASFKSNFPWTLSKGFAFKKKVVGSDSENAEEKIYF